MARHKINVQISYIWPIRDVGMYLCVSRMHVVGGESSNNVTKTFKLYMKELQTQMLKHKNNGLY